jgi:hypothetical protein
MNGAVNPLVTHCQLTTLHIGTLGRSNDGSREPSHQYHSLYASWARFLSSTRSSLQTFIFDQDVNPYISTCGTRRKWTTHREVDVLLSRYILPVLLEAPWPRLKSVKLMGVKELMVGDCVGRMEDEHGPPMSSA